MTEDQVRAIFERAGCMGTLLVQPLDEEREFGLGADQLVVPASVMKVLVALVAETWFAEGRLDPGSEWCWAPPGAHRVRSGCRCWRTMSRCPGGTWSC